MPTTTYKEAMLLIEQLTVDSKGKEKSDLYSNQAQRQFELSGKFKSFILVCVGNIIVDSTKLDFQMLSILNFYFVLGVVISLSLRKAIAV